MVVSVERACPDPIALGTFRQIPGLISQEPAQGDTYILGVRGERSRGWSGTDQCQPTRPYSWSVPRILFERRSAGRSPRTLAPRVIKRTATRLKIEARASFALLRHINKKHDHPIRQTASHRVARGIARSLRMPRRRHGRGFFYCPPLPMRVSKSLGKFWRKCVPDFIA